MYQFSDEINYDHFFRFDKKWIENMNWPRLSKSSKSILPVIAMHCDETGRSFPGERTIAILSGLTDKSVREGIQGLMGFLGFPGFVVTNYLTKLGRRAKRYRLAFPPVREIGRSLFFHKCIIEGGNWREMRQISHALYPVLRYFGHFDQDQYAENEESCEGTTSSNEDFQVLYRNRKWETCEAELIILGKYAGISRPSVYEALKDLEKHHLIEPLGLNAEGVRTWKIFLKPQRYYNRDYLNSKVLRRYRPGN